MVVEENEEEEGEGESESTNVVLQPSLHINSQHCFLACRHKQMWHPGPSLVSPSSWSLQRKEEEGERGGGGGGGGRGGKMR